MKLIGLPMPNVHRESAIQLEVFRCDEGVALIASVESGQAYAGMRITKSQWDNLVSYVAAQFPKASRKRLVE